MVDREKVIQRVEAMLYNICGCTPLEAVLICEDVIVRAEWKYRELKKSRREESARRRNKKL